MRRKLRLSIFVALLSLLLGAIPANATESKAVISLPSFDLESDYSANAVTVIYEENFAENSFEARVLDRESGEALEVVREIPDLPLEVAKSMRKNPLLTRAQRTYDTTLQKDVVLVSSKEGSVVATVWTRVQVTSDHSWAQIEKVYSCGHGAGGSGGYTLNTYGTYNGTSKFPTVSLKIDFNGVIEVSSTNSAGFSLDVLKNLGFSVNSSSSSNWYARKSYNSTTTFKVM